MTRRSVQDAPAPSISDVVADFNDKTSREMEQRARGDRVGILAPFTGGTGAFWGELIARGGWKSGPRGWVASGLAAMERSIFLIKVYFEQHKGGS